MHMRETGITQDEVKLKLYHSCDVCQKYYASKVGVKRHKLRVHDNISDQVTCDTCGKNYVNKELLKQHTERTHSSNPKFVCELCDRRFGNNYHLKRHMNIHTAIMLPCPLCSRLFKRKDGLEAHLKSRHKKTVLEIAKMMEKKNVLF